MERLLYVGNFILPDGNAAAHRVIGNAKAFREAGHEVVLLGCINEVTKEARFRKSQVFGFDYYCFQNPCKTTEWLKYLLTAGWLIRYIEIVHPTIVVIYNYPSWASERLLGYCRRRRIRLYADCTEWFDINEGGFLWRAIKKRDVDNRMYKIQLKLDGIISISSYIDNFYRSKNQKTVWIPGLIDVADEKWRSESQSGERDYTSFCYVGSPGNGMKDRLDIIVKSFSALKKRYPTDQFRLDIIGMTSLQFEHSFGIITDTIEKSICFYGSVHNREALSVLKKGDYSIFFRDKNLPNTAGFPTKFSESIACGTPVITNATSDIPHFINNGNNGFLIDSLDAEEICNQLHKILHLPYEKRKEMKDYCHKARTFDFHNYVEILNHFISE